jgi:predicted nucleic acid-binding protein
MNVAIAEPIYVDPSALTCLYFHQDGSREMAHWRATAGPLAVTQHGRTEVINSICRQKFLGEKSEREVQGALAVLSADFINGRLYHADLIWRAALNRAAELSIEHTPTLGTRASDVLHVACALELNCRRFLTFDERQQELAHTIGLKTISL